MTSNQTRLALAFNLFQQKKFSEAETLFRSILSENPKNYDAAHYFGLLRVCPGTSSGITKFSEHEAD